MLRPLSADAIQGAATAQGLGRDSADLQAVLAAADTRLAFLPVQHARGGLVGQPMYLAAMYVPASFSPARKALFLQAAARGI